MVNDSPEALERMLAAGAWLTSGQIAVLLGRSRTTMWRRLARGDIAWRNTPGGVREFDPADVAGLLAEARQRHGGVPPTSDPGRT